MKIIAGKYGNAAEFTGNTTDKIIIPHNESLNPKNGAVTLMMWVYPTQFVGEWELALLKWQDANPAKFAYHLSLYNKKASIYVKPANVAWLEAIGKTTLSEKEWYHITSVADGINSLRIYVNVIEDGNTIYDGTIADTKVDVCIGGKIDGALFPIHGMIDEVAIFNRLLSDEEIKQSMKSIASSVELDGKLAVTWSFIKAK